MVEDPVLQLGLQHGDDAIIEAAMKADAMLDKGDLDGAALRAAMLPGPSP